MGSTRIPRSRGKTPAAAPASQRVVDHRLAGQVAGTVAANGPAHRAAGDGAESAGTTTDPPVATWSFADIPLDSPDRERTEAPRPGSERPTAPNPGGASIPPSVRSPFERHLGADFSDVRVHRDQQASDAARSLGARAFTFKNHIVFGHDQFRPGTGEGQRLLAHELAHVVQQRALPIGVIQPKLVVKDPSKKLPCKPVGGKSKPEKWQEISRLIRKLSKNTFKVNAKGSVVPSKGKVKPKSKGPCTKRARSQHAINCLCDMVGTKDLWQIIVDDQQWPHTMPRTIVINSRCAPFKTMAWGGPRGARTRPVALSQWRVLAHELCGHAHLMHQRAHPANVVAYKRGRMIGRIHHDTTVEITNKIARQVAPSSHVPRALFATGHHGESIIHFGLKGFKKGHSTLTGSMKTKAHQIAAVMDKDNNRKLRAEVLGHTDPLGGKRRNTSVSWWRAHKVRMAIIKGFPRTKQKLAGIRVHPAIARSTKGCPATAKPADCRKVDVYLFSREGSRQGYKYKRFTSVKLSAWAKSTTLTRTKVWAVKKRLRKIRSVYVGLNRYKPYSKLVVTLWLRSMKLSTLKRVLKEIATLGIWAPAEVKATERVLVRAWRIRHRTSLP